MKQALQRFLDGIKVNIISTCCVAAGSILCIAGCVTGTPQTVATVSQQPVFSTVPVSTNQVSSTNAAGVVTQQTVTNYTTVTNFVAVTNYSTVTNYAPSQTITNIATGIQTAATLVGAVAPAYSLPVSTVAGWATALLFGIATGVASYKNGQSKSIIQAIIAGVEGAPPPGGNDSTPITTTQVKQSIQTAATAAGVQPVLNAIVKATT